MFRRSRQFRFRSLLGFLFLSSLIFCVWMGDLQRVRIGKPVAAQAPVSSEMGEGLVCVAPGLETVTQTTLDPNQQVQQGVERYQAGDSQAAIDHWTIALDQYQQTNNQPAEAIVLENLARAFQTLGQTQEELACWQQATTRYQHLGETQTVGRLLTEQAQAYTRFGQYRQAVLLLCGTLDDTPCTPDSALAIARREEDIPGEIGALGSLGNAYHLLGNYDQAIATLQNSLPLLQTAQPSPYQSSILIGLGNAYIGKALVNYQRANSAVQFALRQAESLRQAAQDNDATALTYLKDSLAIAQAQQDKAAQLRAWLSVIPASYRVGNRAEATVALNQAIALLNDIPPTAETVYAAINLAKLLRPVSPENPTLSRTQCFIPEMEGQTRSLLEQAAATAQHISNRRAESFALGELGLFYECRGHYTGAVADYEQAIQLTQAAQWAAEQEPDSLYLWQWQVGRVLKSQGESTEAIAAYERSISTLETIRNDLLTANRDLQFDFRDTIEPVYRQFIELRLQQTETARDDSGSDSSPDTLTSALKALDSLQLAELQDYFGSDCELIAAPQAPLNLADGKTVAAIFNSVILPDRTALVVTLPGGQRQLSWIQDQEMPLDQTRLRQVINAYRDELQYSGSDLSPYIPNLSRTLYDWLIAPFAEALEQAQVNTLVFIQDGILRSVPMAALYDGEQFLIERYAIATTPSLSLTTLTPSLQRNELRALAMGVNQVSVIDGYGEFPPLNFVDEEIAAIQAILPESEGFLNDQVNLTTLQQTLRDKFYPIIHFATHGQFGTTPENTFLVLGNNQKITITELEKIFRRALDRDEQIELLTLSACETATGDDRAALGLGGIAIQAGARSAFASLWTADDKAITKTIERFYSYLRNTDMSKAQALQAAQIDLIKGGGTFAEPAYWAPFTLIGNWL